MALVKAYKLSKLNADGVSLVVVGRPAWNYQEILEQISSTAGVTWLGFVSEEEKIALMQAAELFVFPSLYEGFGFPVLEAMAAGTPVICSDRGSLSEVAGPARRFEGLEAETIADGLRDALADEAWRENVVDLGREWAKSFSWDASVESHLRIYRKLAR